MDSNEKMGRMSLSLVSPGIRAAHGVGEGAGKPLLFCKEREREILAARGNLALLCPRGTATRQHCQVIKYELRKGKVCLTKSKLWKNRLGPSHDPAERAKHLRPAAAGRTCAERPRHPGDRGRVVVCRTERPDGSRSTGPAPHSRAPRFVFPRPAL